MNDSFPVALPPDKEKGWYEGEENIIGLTQIRPSSEFLQEMGTDRGVGNFFRLKNGLLAKSCSGAEAFELEAFFSFLLEAARKQAFSYRK